MYNRNTISNIKAALQDSPLVLVNGARQVGKSTLAKLLFEDTYPLLFKLPQKHPTPPVIHNMLL